MNESITTQSFSSDRIPLRIEADPTSFYTAEIPVESIKLTRAAAKSIRNALIPSEGHKWLIVKVTPTKTSAGVRVWRVTYASLPDAHAKPKSKLILPGGLR